MSNTEQSLQGHPATWYLPAGTTVHVDGKPYTLENETKVAGERPKMDALKLCYIDETWAYFSETDPTEVWGDDWNDAPYEHNAGTPYHEFNCVAVAFHADVDRPDAWHYYNSPWSVQDINQGRVPWLMTPRHSDAPMVKIMAGTTLSEFIRLIRSVGGKVFMEVGAVSDGE